MKKENSVSRGRAIALTSLSIACCAALIGGATFALFQSSSSKDITVSSGSLEVSSELTLVQGKSLGEDYTAAEGNVYNFFNGGVASVDEEGSLNLVNITPGDYVKAELVSTNSSSIKIAYRLMVNGDLGALDFDVFNAENQSVLSETETGYVSEWMVAEPGAAINTYTVEIGINTNVTEPVSAQFSITLQAVQANAVPAEGNEGNATVTIGNGSAANYQSLEAAIEAVNADESTEKATILLLAGTYQPTADRTLLVTRDNVEIAGVGMDATVIDGNNHQVDGQAVLAISGDNVTVKDLTIVTDYAANNNIAGIKASNFEVENERISNVTIDGVRVIASGKYAVNIHGVENAAVKDCVLENYAWSGLALANSDVTLSGTVFENTANATTDIRMNYANSEAYANPAVLTLGEGIAFSGAVAVYSECALTNDMQYVLNGYEQYNLSIADLGAYGWVTRSTVVTATPETIDAALASLYEGDTLVLAEGTYSAISVNLNNITIQGAGADKTIINNYLNVGKAGGAELNANISGVTVTGNKENYASISINSNFGNNAAVAEGNVLNISDSVISNAKWGVQVASAVKNTALNLKNVSFENVWCAISVKNGETGNTYTVDDSVNFSGVTYQLQAFYPNIYWGVIGNEETKVDGSLVKYVATSEELSNAIKSAASGTVITIAAGEYEVAPQTLIPAGVTLAGAEGAVIKTCVDKTTFQLSDGSVLSGLEFDATAITSGAVDILSVAASNATVENCKFTGSYTDGSNLVVRGMSVSHNVSNVTVKGNSFVALRQPAYINSGAQGVVSDNYVEGTRGFVVEISTEIAFSGNEFLNNAVDICITKDNAIDGQTDYYDIQKVSADNNGCFVEDQYNKLHCTNGSEPVEY